MSNISLKKNRVELKTQFTLLFHDVFGTLSEIVRSQVLTERSSDGGERGSSGSVADSDGYGATTAPAPACDRAMTAVISNNIHCQHYFYCVITKVQHQVTV